MAKFRSTARTVDLLGRQQIAGVPTAIHELFKNAHDAYATHAEVDYYSSDSLLVIRDDGLGMTREDFEQRWLVVGTESKRLDSERAKLPVDKSKAKRTLLGEKGIGRLATGLLGDQVLILSRPERDGVLGSGIAAYVDWRLFAEPDLQLHEIEIPVRDLLAGSACDKHLVGELVDEFLSSLAALVQAGRLKGTMAATLDRDARRFAELDPSTEEAALPGPSSLRLGGGNRGTQFWIQPAVETVVLDLAESDDRASRVELQLSGFTNVLAADADATDRLSVAFRHHKAVDEADDLIAPDRFFSREDFENADHQVVGSFDESGTFTGTVSVFGTEHRFYVDPPQRGATAAGAFEVSFCAVQAMEKQSSLPTASWHDFKSRANRLGGVYVYVDGVRVLPFGAPDFDWLEIEMRRTKGAAFYYFSHRNMFGTVSLSRTENPGIVEKAGREGFVQNAAYRQLRGLIENLLLRVAAEFFREKAPREAAYVEGRERHENHAKTLERRAKQTNEQKRALHVHLAQLEETLSNPDAALRLRKRVEAALSGARSLDASAPPQVRSEIEAAIRSATAEVAEMRRRIEVSPPKMALSKDLGARVERAQRDAAVWRAQTLEPVQGLLDEAQARLSATPDEPADVRAVVAARIAEAARELRRDAVSTAKAVTKAAEALGDTLRTEVYAIAERLDGLAAQTASGDLSESPEFEATAERMRARGRALLQLAAGHAARLKLDPDDDPSALLEALEQRAEDATERLGDELESAQLGLAVEILSHEFDHYVGEARGSIRALENWARANPDLGKRVLRLKTSFERIDGYLQLLAPLQRRRNRTRVVFTGGHIASYLRRVFVRRLKDEEFVLNVTRAFEARRIEDLVSPYYTVFVNLVDNAAFWTRGLTERAVTLDVDGTDFVVRDTGVGVPPGHEHVIFEPRYSLKPGGRGLGLAIGRDALRANGADLLCDEADPERRGATFRIKVPPDRIRDGESANEKEA